MNQLFDPELIEHIVQEVIRRLVERGIVVREAANTDETELALNDKLVTLASTGFISGRKG